MPVPRKITNITFSKKAFGTTIFKFLLSVHLYKDRFMLDTQNFEINMMVEWDGVREYFQYVVTHFRSESKGCTDNTEHVQGLKP